MRLICPENYGPGFKFEKLMTIVFTILVKNKTKQKARCLNVGINVFNVKETFMLIFKQRGFCFAFYQDSAVVIDFSNLDVL